MCDLNLVTYVAEVGAMEILNLVIWLQRISLICNRVKFHSLYLIGSEMIWHV